MEREHLDTAGKNTITKIYWGGGGNLTRGWINWLDKDGDKELKTGTKSTREPGSRRAREDSWIKEQGIAKQNDWGKVQEGQAKKTLPLWCSNFLTL